MKRTEISKITAGQKVNIRGFVDIIRDQKSIQFVIIRDASGKVQVTVFKPEKPEIAKIFETLLVESVVSVTGSVVAAPNVKLGGIEIIPDSVEVLSSAKVSPIDEKSAVDLQMDYRWLDLRDPKKRAYFQIQTLVKKAMFEYFTDNGFTYLDTPKLSSANAEGGSEVFEVKYFDQKAYLTQSPQFYKQMAMASGFEKYFEFCACYRAEKSFTSRHATEFVALDVELAYIDDHHDVMDVEENMIKYVLAQTEKTCGKIMKDVLGIDFKAQTAKFPRIKLLDAYDLLEKEKGYKVPRANKGDLDPEGERLLCEIAREKYNSDFIFITDYPVAGRVFYSARHENDTTAPQLTKTFDLLYKGVEITSGGQREHNPEKLKSNMLDKGIDPKTMQTYISFFEYGCPPHGGFALGFGRFFAKLLEIPSIKDATYLFRGPDRLTP
jgi:aspartyl-tRNA synthetase